MNTLYYYYDEIGEPVDIEQKEFDMILNSYNQTKINYEVRTVVEFGLGEPFRFCYLVRLN